MPRVSEGGGYAWPPLPNNKPSSDKATANDGAKTLMKAISKNFGMARGAGSSCDKGIVTLKPKCPAKSGTIAVRKDFKPVKSYASGSYQRAVAVARDPRAKAAAMEDFTAAIYTKGTKAVKGGYWSTWQGLHKAWYGSGSEALPITVERLSAVGMPT